MASTAQGFAKYNRKTDKGLLKFKTINICGLSERSKFLLNQYIDRDEIGILALQELDTSDRDLLQLENMFFITDTNKGANSGAALYVKDTYSITPLNEISKMSRNIDSCWGLVIANNKKYIIGSVYVKLNYPPAIKEVMKMLEKAVIVQKNLKATGVILAGDFNARHLMWGDNKTTKYGQDLVDMIDDTVFSICTADSPTFLCSGGSSVIDLFIMTNNLTEKMNYCKTDEEVELWTGAPQRGHLPVEITFYSKTPKTIETVKKLDISQMPWDMWTENIEKEIDEEKVNLQNEENPYLLMNKMNNIISEATKQHGKFKNSCQHSKPFWSPHLSDHEQVLPKAMKTYKKKHKK